MVEQDNSSKDPFSLLNSSIRTRYPRATEEEVQAMAKQILDTAAQSIKMDGSVFLVRRPEGGQTEIKCLNIVLIEDNK
ncbi:hypothetical protein KKD37_04550 [Patescibacteria group bacterium]|nr:hypothetical protein [Patescibacteria group bacterium]